MALSPDRREVPVRQYWVDALRAVCMVLVVWFHLSADYFPGIAHYLSPLPIPAFVFLSGFQMGQRRLNSSPGEFFLRACRPFIIIYFAFGIVTFIPWWLKNAIKPDPIFDAMGPAQAFFALLYGAVGPELWLPFDPPLWFLTFMTSLLMSYYLLWQSTRAAGKALAGSVVLCLCGIWSVNHLTVRPPWNMDIAWLALPFFAFGQWARAVRLDDAIRCRPRTAAAALPALVLVSYFVVPHAEHVNFHLTKIGNPLLLLISGGCAIVVGTILAIHMPRVAVLEKIGRHSLVIMVLHADMLMVINSLLKRAVGEGFEFMYKVPWGCACVVALSCWLCILMAVPIRRFAPWMLRGRLPDWTVTQHSTAMPTLAEEREF